METQKMICIECPRGCELTVTIDNGILVSGNFCARGKAFAQAEVTNPIRCISSTVRLENGQMLPVRTDGGIAKENIFSVMQKINLLCPKLPIACGDILLANIDDCGINLIACSTKNQIEL